MPRKPKPTAAPDVTAALPLRLEWMSPAELAENPANWRTHPNSQIAALTDVIAEVGWAGVCLYNETTGRLVDGHARKKVAVNQGAEKIPVLIGRWTEEQEKKILATLDPLAGMAEADPGKLDLLLRGVQTGSAAVAALLANLAKENQIIPPDGDQAAGAEDQSGDLAERFQVLVVCKDEAQQTALLERLSGEGLECRSLIS